MIITKPVTGWNIQRPTTHPGAVLREDFLKPLDLTPASIGMRTGISLGQIEGVLNERLNVSADMALRLARFFGTSPEFWLNLQSAHDLAKARFELNAILEAEIEPLKPESVTA